jgi:imidazolonepropionase-like amidohydrolase
LERGGKVADIVLLAADPTEEIANLAQIESVVLRGQLQRRENLDRLLEDAARLARRR